jgi:hypothetical protein
VDAAEFHGVGGCHAHHKTPLIVSLSKDVSLPSRQSCFDRLSMGGGGV